MGETRNTYTILVEKHEGRRPLGRPRHKYEDNIRKDLREIWWENADWIHMAQHKGQLWAVVNTVMKLRVP